MNVKSQRLNLVYVMNSSIALNFVRGQLKYFQDRGFDVTVLCPKRRDEEWEVPSPNGIRVCEVPMERPIAPWRDLVTLWRLWSKMRELRPVVTNVGTPKAGLLGGLAAWLNRVPCRFYTLHGLRFETATGLIRRLLVGAERLACRLAHRVVCVSPSTREKAIASALVTRERTVVTGCGSCNGVDVSRFAANPELNERARKLRQQLGIPERATAVLFVGRLTRDKGIPELLEAFLRLEKQFSELWLVLVGCYEDGDPLPCETKRNLQAHPRIIFAGAVPDTAAYYATADIVALPSHREGLPTVILEAHAAGKPVVGAQATGIVDVVAHEKTGLLFPVGNVPALTEAVARLITDKALACRLGFAGQEQVRRNFQQERVWEALYREYFRVLHASGLASSRGPHIPKSKGLMVRHNE